MKRAVLACAALALAAAYGCAGKPPEPVMALVGPGTFVMGSEEGEPDERPAHEVTLTRAIYVAVHAVTNDDYALYCRASGLPVPRERWDGAGDDPVMGVDWYDAVGYCNWLSELHGLAPCYTGAGTATACDFDAGGYRLPTEAEWEWAARGGPAGGGFQYPGSDDPLAVAWFDENSGDRTHPVGRLAPNEAGLFDMAGNMYEWCWDYYARDAYASAAAVDPTGPTAGNPATPRGPEHARRGSSWREGRGTLRTTFRGQDYASYPGDNGFRLVRTAPSP